MTRSDFIRDLRRLQEGDISALEQLYNNYFINISVTALSIMKNENDAYDVAMNVLMKLVEFQGDVSEINNPTAFLIAVTKNEARDVLRKKSRVVNLSDFYTIYDQNAHELLWLTDILKSLTREKQNIFLRHVVWGETLKAISESIGCSVRTIKRTYQRIKEKIKEIYKQ